MTDDVKRPRHYEGDGVTTCDVAMRSMMHGVSVSPDVAYWWGCALKYVFRWPWKGGMQDLKKARECLARIIELEGGSVDD